MPTGLKVLKQAASKCSKAVLSLENCRGWIRTLRQVGLDEKGIVQGITGFPRIVAYSAVGQEMQSIEVLRVLEQAGLCSEQYAPRMAPPLIHSASSLQFNVVEWLTSKGFTEPLIRRMVLRNPALLKTSPGVLGLMLEYVAWVMGSKEAAVKLLTKQPLIIGIGPISIHAKLLMLKELVGCRPSLMLTRWVSADRPIMEDPNNYHIISYSMHTRIGPRCILMREMGLAQLMYAGTWVVKINCDFAAWRTLVQVAGIAGRVDIGANGFGGDIEAVKTHGLAIENIRGMQRSMATISARQRGNDHFTAKEYVEAIAAYSQGLDTPAPSGVQNDGGERGLLLSNRAACHLELGELSSAAQDARAALLILPSNAKAHYRLALSLPRDHPDAAPAVAAAVALWPPASRSAALASLYKEVQLSTEEAEAALDQKGPVLLKLPGSMDAVAVASNSKDAEFSILRGSTLTVLLP
eukprot:gene15001-21068_t